MSVDVLGLVRNICLRIGGAAIAVVAIGTIYAWPSLTALCQAAMPDENDERKVVPIVAGYQKRHQSSRRPTQLHALEADGVVEADDDGSLQVHSMLPGRVSCDNIVVGQFYRKGDLLAVVDSPMLVTMRAEFVTRMEENETSVRKTESELRLAQSELNRIRQLWIDGISARKDLRNAEEAVLTAEQYLRDLKDIRENRLNESTMLAEIYGVRPPAAGCRKLLKELPLIAPGDGVVIKKNLTLGDRIEPGDLACVMAETHKVCLKVQLPICQRRQVVVGQQACFSCDQVPQASFSGRVKGTTVNDESAKHLLVNIDLENSKRLLRPAMSGRVRIFLGPPNAPRTKMASTQSPLD